MPKRDPSHMAAQRLRILRAAFECIAENGIGGTSIAGIRRRAGLSAGALYVHFRSKEEIIAATVLQYRAGPCEAAEDWPSLTAAMTSTEDLCEFDLVTVIRAKHYLNAEVVRPGYLSDITRPLLQAATDDLARNLRRLHDQGRIRLPTDAGQTALHMQAFIEGMLWIGLAHGRSLAALAADIRDGLDRFVTVSPDRSAIEDHDANTSRIGGVAEAGAAPALDRKRRISRRR